MTLVHSFGPRSRRQSGKVRAESVFASANSAQTISGGTLSVVDLDKQPELSNATDIGLAFGAEIACKFGRVRISPEFPCTRWGGENLRDPVNALLRTHRNQGDLMIGFTLQLTSGAH